MEPIEDPSKSSGVDDRESSTEIPGSSPHETRRRKVRKRIRIKKKKKKPLKKIRKFMEAAAWVIIIGGFITLLVILVKQLELQDDKAKKKKSYAEPKREMLVAFHAALPKSIQSSLPYAGFNP